MIKRFEDLIAWQKAQELAVCMYDEFGQMKDFAFRDQMIRAVISISNNIAEGFERQSRKEFYRFLNIASSSCSEVRSMLYLAEKLKYTTKEQMEGQLSKANEVSKVLNGLMKSVLCNIKNT